MRCTTSTLLTVIGFTIPASLAAQVRTPRSQDYLFLSSVSDVRATWVNPAGLGAIPEASIMAEFTGGRNLTDGFFVEQYALGFNSRGMSLTYVRNRFDGSPSTSMLRLAVAYPIARGAVGFAVSQYGAPGDNEREVDVGFQFALTPNVTLAAVVRHLGRPAVGTDTLAIQLGAGGLLALARGQLQFAAEAYGSERRGPAESGFDMAYRGGVLVGIPFRRPIVAFAVADLGSNVHIDRINFGFAFGGRTHVGAVGSAVSRNDSPYVTRLSLSGVSSRLLIQQ